MIALLAAALLSLAAAGGLLLAILNLRRARVPGAAGGAHALAAVAGTGLLAVAAFSADHGVAVNAALLLFAVAAIGGGFVWLFRLQGERPPLFMIALHGATALVALAVLWTGLLGAG